MRTRYGPHGLEVESEDGRFGAWFGLRAQLRYSYPFDDDPIEPGDFSATDEHELAIRRARLKSGGHAYGLRLEYYVEYELQNSALLDLRFTLTHSQPLAFRVGQWKAEYNRERRDSSGEQQFVERSIVNYVFTIDRQPGMMLFGRLFAGERIDSRYFLAVLSGAGRGNSDNEGTPMWLARYQWNFCGRDLPFSQSDVELREDVAGSLAVAGVINRSRFTRFSQQGGGELAGLPADVAEAYDTRQAVAELAFQHRGFSFQSEFHWKEVEDRTSRATRRYDGGYAQVGHFFHTLFLSFPRPLEVAFRAAYVDGDPTPDSRRGELTAGANWFFHGHRNKVTLDGSRLTLKQSALDEHAWRLRLQWDVSI